VCDQAFCGVDASEVAPGCLRFEPELVEFEPAMLRLIYPAPEREDDPELPPHPERSQAGSKRDARIDCDQRHAENVRRPADARPELLRLVQSGGYLIIGEMAVLGLELLKLASEVVGTPQRREQGPLRDSIGAAWELQEGDALSLDPTTDRAVTHSQQ